MSIQTTKSRVRGAIVGTAIGDALGMPVEGLKPSTIAKRYGVIRSFTAPRKGTWAKRTHNLKRGQWTDDTQLMLAIGESIAERGCFDFADIAKRHILTMKDKRGWGGSTISGITKIKAGVNWWNSAKPDGAGNGTPMKIAPIGVLLALRKVMEFESSSAIVNISRMTHGDPRPAVAGILQASAVACGIIGGSKGLCASIINSPHHARALEETFGRVQNGLQISECLDKAMDLACTGSVEQIRGAVGAGSFVAESFPFTFALVWKLGDDPERCLQTIVNQGGDADTTGAMAGALLGSAYGLSAFPSRWRRGLEAYKRLLSLADSLFDMPPLGAKVSGSFTRPKIAYSRTKR